LKRRKGKDRGWWGGVGGVKKKKEGQTGRRKRMRSNLEKKEA
jgi:hypothetical protein